MSLEREVTVYERIRPHLLAAGLEGKFILIHRDDVVGIYSTFDLAINAGYERTLTEAFFVKQIAEKEEPKYFSRNITR